MTSPVDWQVAARRAAALAPPGPTGTRAELRAVVQVLRRAAAEAPGHVGETTGLHRSAERAARAPVYVIDRARWAEANVELFASLTDGLLPATGGVGSRRMAGEESGVLLALLAPRVLGQFDPFTTAEQGPGRLLLVAPNVLKVERDLDLDAMDFRLWVCLHEQTHAVQFAAAPWLADHLRGRMRALVGTVAATEEAPDRVQRLVRALVETVRSVAGGRSGGSELAGPLVEAFLDEEERAGMGEVVAVMSLLEGHADVVMDAVGPARLPSVRRIRASFERRRDGTTVLDVLLRRLLGMDAKVAQYRNGARFVRSVVDKVGHDGLNAVWVEADNLPTVAEIADPAAWVRRVHG